MEIKLDGWYESNRFGPIRRVLATDRNSKTYPVIVEFPDGAVEVYTSQGVGYFKDQLTEVCEFQQDDMVMVRDSCKDQWERRMFSHMDEGQYLCFSDSCSEWDSSGSMTPWKYCRKLAVEELGE